MKLGATTKLDKRNKRTFRKIDDDVISENCDAIAVFPIHNQSEAIGMLDSGCINCKIYIMVISNLLT